MAWLAGVFDISEIKADVESLLSSMGTVWWYMLCNYYCQLNRITLQITVAAFHVLFRL